jgi:hypothetical protein
MAINFSTLVYQPCQDTFGRTVTVTPVASQPGGAAYTRRGIFGTRPVNIETAIGMAVLSDQETVFYIREVEYPTLPQQGDLLSIPVDDAGNPAEDNWIVTDSSRNGGGETTLTLQKVVPAS